MQPIPENMRELLKSRSMVGENQPAATVYFGGEKQQDYLWNNTARAIRSTTSSGNPDFHYAGSWGGGSFVTRADGKVLVTYCNTNEKAVYLSVVDSEDDLFYHHNKAAENEWVFTTVTVMWRSLSGIACSRLFRLPNGNILLFVLDVGGNLGAPCVLYTYRSLNGLGTDFTLLGEIYRGEKPEVDYDGYRCGIGQPIQITDRIVIPWIGAELDSGEYYRYDAFCSYSDNGGQTWTTTKVYWGGSIKSFSCRGIGKCGDQLTLLVGRSYGSGQLRLYTSDDRGGSWQLLTYLPSCFPQTSLISSAMFWGQDGYNYWRIEGDGIYRRSDKLPLPADETAFERGPGTTWGEPYCPAQGDDDYEVMWRTGEGNLAIAGTSYYADGSISWIVGGKATEADIIPAKAISIQRNRGMAAEAKVEIDNKDGKYSPDSEGDWKEVIWPNRQITIEQGYGGETMQTFTGLIDKIEVTSHPQTITITARDQYKRALDQTICEPGTTNRVVLFENETVDAIVTTLAGWAGLPCVAEATGIIITKDFAWETYADAIQWCCDLTGFEAVVDEQGTLQFRFPTDRQPEGIEEITLDGTDWVALEHTPIVAESQRVTDIDGETTYIPSTDYEVEYGPARIRRVTGGGISDGETVQVRYVYAAWTFREGEDIISIDYTIDDTNLYYEAVVYGQRPIEWDSEGEPTKFEAISAVAPYNPRDYFQVLPHKILKIDAPDADTEEKCQEIADRAIYQMKSRARICRFKAVAIPWLQVGDCVQIIESSSNVSEIYRITDMAIKQAADGFTMELTTYHYGYAPLGGDE